jgi:hypothetical protein
MYLLNQMTAGKEHPEKTTGKKKTFLKLIECIRDKKGDYI